MPRIILHSADIEAEHQQLITRQIPGDIVGKDQFGWLETDVSVLPDQLNHLRMQLPFDINLLPDGFEPDQAKLLVTDMDSTLISIECVDEIADYLGIKPQVAAITESAMRGEIDFQTSLRQRVGLLKGLDSHVLQSVYDERLSLNPGAEKLMSGLKAAGIKTALVSGGFTFFTSRLQQRLDIDFILANELEIEEDKLTGHVLGDIVDGSAKANFLETTSAELGIDPQQAIAMGDGANDLLMMSVAGLGVAYHAKPAVQGKADIVINHQGLDAVLHLLNL